MKNLLFMLSVLFAFCSCTKDYPQLLNERVNQYRKEGKWILSYSKKATENEHYIVYADKKIQSIVVDSLDGQNHYPLKKLKAFQIAISNDDSLIWTDISEDVPLKLASGRTLLLETYEGELQADRISGYKDKYMIADFGNGGVAIIFLKANKVCGLGIHTERYLKNIGTDWKIAKNGDINIRLRYELAMSYDGLPEFSPCEYQFVMDSNGNVKSKDDHFSCYGVKIPASAMGGYYEEALAPYAEEIRQVLGSGTYEPDNSFEEASIEHADDVAEKQIDKPVKENKKETANLVEEERPVIEAPTKPAFTLTPVEDMPKRSTVEKDKVFDVVGEQASFPGGQGALMQWLKENIKYPAIAAANGIEGRVIVQFVVSKTGSISNVKVARGVDPSLDKEAVRVISSMPKWTPGKQSGKTVNVRLTLPVTFRL